MIAALDPVILIGPVCWLLRFRLPTHTLCLCISYSHDCGRKVQVRQGPGIMMQERIESWRGRGNRETDQ